ncbi:MFS transporter [Roseobacter sinensis]|uniref:MFS transporter n=1 Tax=Roseobacter sinensis TaxID=2931391 RepID=A0ABT3BEM1_9RHOB|nr:MFS transporter [Roseobacter sp. WL0113]MCV3272020.1 MFS transporter [Roseobacter sp. WL0113]
MSVIRRLSGAAYGTHFADQVALVSVPLIAALAFDASPAVIGTLVACQSSAHLLGSVPFGLLVDKRQLRHLAMASALISASGFALATVSVLLQIIVLFGMAITLAGFGVVLFGLTALSIIPQVARADGLGRANAAIEVPRAMCSFVVPLLLGLIITDVPSWTLFLAASLGSLVAFLMSCSLPRFQRRATPGQAVLQTILEGGSFVMRHALLLPISLCAVCWNFAFAALLVVLVPAIADLFVLDPGSFGIALSAFGLAAIGGSWLSGRVANRLRPSVILLFGPGSSAVAAAGLLVIGPDTAARWLYAMFFLLGFGPSMWLVAQNSVRQLVTPPQMLGRVNAVIQTAIYGVRPVGALVGGVWASQFGVTSGLHLVVAAFTLSFLVPVLSDLRRVASYRAIAPDQS